MPLADGTEAQNEPTAICRCAGLVWVPHYARIEQSRRFERVFVKEVSADQTTLRLVEYGMRLQRLFHLCSARLEDLEQVAVATFEIFEHFGELARGNPVFELKDPADDMIGPGLVCRVEVSRLSRRFEGSDDDPGGIRTQM